MADRYYKDDQVIYYPAESVNFIVDLWRNFANDKAFPVNESEFFHMDEFIQFLKNEGHFERLQGRWYFTNMDNMQYLWEFYLIPSYGYEDIDGGVNTVDGTRMLLPPHDYGGGFEGFLKTILYHMMNKSWFTEEMSVPGSGFEMTTDVRFKARLLNSSGIACGTVVADYDPGEYYNIKCKTTTLKSIERKVKRNDEQDFYKILLFDIPNIKMSQHEFCVYKIFKNMLGNVPVDFNRTYEDYNDILTSCKRLLKESNWSLYEIKQSGEYWEIINSFENIHKKFKLAFVIFVIGGHAKVTCIDGNGKRGCEYFKSKCPTCEEYVKLSKNHFDSCSGNVENAPIIQNVEMKEYGMDHVENMEQNSQIVIDNCLEALKNNQSIYVNGPGGSGKSKLINAIVKKFAGKTKVLASTAEVAKRFGGGQTVHSFFHLSKFEKKFKKGVWHAFHHDRISFEKYVNSKFDYCPDYVIIDESGMLDGNFIDTLDYVCRVITQRFDRHFGNIKFAFMLDECQLPPVKSKLKMYTTSQIRLIRLKNSFTLDGPWRLSQGVNDKEELLKQFVFLEKCRLGKTPDLDFINFMLDKEVDYGNIDGTVLVRTNESARKLNKRIFESRDFIKLWSKNPFEFYLGMEVICTSNVAKIWGDYKPINGSRGVVIGSKQYKGESVVCVRFEKGECMFRNYYSDEDVKNKQGWTVDIVCSKVITIHRSQGMTIPGKIYIEWMHGGPGFQKGMLYVALSRCQNLRNIFVIRNKTRKPEMFFENNLHWSPLAVSIANEPTKLQPDYLIENEENYYSLADNSRKKETFTFRDKRFTKPPKEIKGSRILCDYKFGEYSHLFDHAIIIDHETANAPDGKQRPICTYVKYYVNGMPHHFNDLLKDYNNIPEHKNPLTLKRPKYGWDQKFKMMEFSFDYSENPIEDLCMGICMILEMGKIYEVNKMKTGDAWSTIRSTTMTDWGFNNNGFDVFFFFKEFLENGKWNFKPTLVNAGTMLKLFKLTTTKADGKDFVLYQTRDLMQICGSLGGFDGAVKSWCKNIIQDLIKGVNLENYVHPFNPKYFEEYYDARGREIFTDKHKIIADYGAFKKKREMELKNLVLLSENIQQYVKNGELTKGFAPLKLVVERLGTSQKIWKKIPNKMNMVQKYGGVGGFIRNCYYPREHDKVIEKIQSDGNYSFFENYDLKKDYKDYARLDVFLTELLMRALNDTVFKFGSEIETSTGEKIAIESSRGQVISGTRTCLLRYATTAQLVQQITFTNLPDCCIRSDTGLFIETELYLLPRVFDKMVNGILGGKTLARRLHFQSKGDDDYMQYADFSGMYMKILEQYYYPYGPFRHYTRKNQKAIKDLENAYKNKCEDFFNKCALYKVKIRAHEKEIEPVFGEKRLRKSIKYSTKPSIVYATNYEMRVFSDYDCELISIEECIYWKYQVKMFENVMKYYAALKNHAESTGDKVGRAFAKLMANSTFGTMAKSDKHECTMTWSTPQELMAIFSQYGSSKFMRAPTTIGRFHMAKIDTGDSVNLNTNIPYLGRFTLGASKIMLYDSIRIAYGENRFSDENFNNMLCYGDTDSIVLHRSCIERLIKHDETVSEENQLLFYSGGNADLKAGKLTDEIKDDLDKYFDDPEYVKAVLSVNKHWSNVANPRIVECFNPAAKSGGVKFKIPQFEKDGKVYKERYGFKTFCKGIAKNSYIYVKVPPSLKHLKAPDGVHKMGNDEETYELFKFGYQHLLPISSQPQSTLKRVIFANSKEYEAGIRAMDIQSVTLGEKRAWMSVPENLLEEIHLIKHVKPDKKRKDIDFCVENANKRGRIREVIGKEEIDSVKRGERTMFEISDGPRIWNHYSISNEQPRSDS